jgi:collagen triple helix repeat protein
MSTMRLAIIAFILSTIAAAQCTPAVPGPGTNCAGPVFVQPPPNNTTQTYAILVDMSLPAPAPAATKYILSIVNGTIQESDNGGTYHTLKGDKGDPGLPGLNGRDGVNGTNGTTGATGATGLQGIQGIPGVDSFAIGSSMTVTVTGCNIIGVGRTCVLKRVK